MAGAGGPAGDDRPAGGGAPPAAGATALIGIDSVQCPMALRLAAWSRLARDLDRGLLATMTTTEPFERVFEVGEAILKGKVRGRVVLQIS